MSKQPKQPKHQPSMTATQQLPAVSARMQRGDHSGAASQLELLAKESPNDGRVFDLLSTCQAMLARRVPAVVNARKALVLLGDQPQAVARCASVLQRAGEYDEALLHVEKALYKGKDPNLLRLKTILLSDLGKDRQSLKALKELRKAVGLTDDPNPKLGLAILNARLAPSVVDPGEAIAELEPCVLNTSGIGRTRAAGAFQLGRLREHLEEHDRAFEGYALGKSIDKPTWDPDAHTRRIDALIECWTNAPDGIASAIDGSNMVFIVGMMRSGTSLTEQMLAQCPGVTPGDELSIVDDVIRHIEQSSDRPLACAREKYTAETVSKFSAHGIKAYEAHFGTPFTSSVCTDKQPENFYHLPLIARLFPGCKIIHCTRDPMDCCVSNFVQSFAQGFPHTHDLAWLGRYHRDYQRVMENWRAMPEIEMLEVSYEQLVSDPETQTRRIAEHAGVQWTDQILRFHESKRTVKTASREQVRSALNTRSVGRHERFAEHLAPLRDALGIHGP